MFRTLICGFISIMFALSAIPVYSQQPTASPSPPQKQEDVVRTTTATVQVEAIVTDKSGKRVPELTAEDLVVLDEGAAQQVDFFSEIERSKVRQAESGKTTPANPQASGGDAGTRSPLSIPYQGHHIAVILDDLNMSTDNFLRTRRALTDYINSKLLPTDMMAIVSTGGSIASLQQFTNDKQRLLSALNRLGVQNSISAKILNQRYKMSATEAMRIDSGDTMTLERVKQRVRLEDSETPVGTIADQTQRGAAPERQLDRDTLDAQLRTIAKNIVTQMSQMTRATLSAMESLFKGMADLPGRKVAIFLSESLLTMSGSSGDLNSLVQQLIDIARRSGVSVYALDATGLQSNSLSATEYMTGNSLQQRGANLDLTLSDSERLGAVRSLVIGTGGELISNTNDLNGGLEKAIDDSSNYYVVGFRPKSLDNKFHHLAVTVKGRPELIVRTRRGYLAINPETARGTQAELLDALMRSPVPRIDLPLEVIANVVPRAGEQVVLVGLHVGRNYLSLPGADAQDQTAAYEVVSYVFATGFDKPVGGVVRTLNYDLAKDPDARQKLRTEGFVLVKDYVQLPPGQYQARAVIREKTTGAVGSAYQFFEIPDLKAKGISASSLILTTPGQPGFKGHYSFKKAGEIELTFLLYNLPKDTSTVTQQVRLIDDQGRIVVDSALPLSNAAATASPGQFPQATRLTLPTARGHYSLVVNVKDSKRKVDLERRTDLIVE